jgi:hypothetical protein
LFARVPLNEVAPGFQPRGLRERRSDLGISCECQRLDVGRGSVEICDNPHHLRFNLYAVFVQIYRDVCE